MAKFIKTALPTIGKKTEVYEATLTMRLARKDIEGQSIQTIINIVEKHFGPAINTLIAKAKNQADQWAAETATEKRFLKDDQ